MFLKKLKERSCGGALVDPSECTCMSSTVPKERRKDSTCAESAELFLRFWLASRPAGRVVARLLHIAFCACSRFEDSVSIHGLGGAPGWHAGEPQSCIVPSVARVMCTGEHQETGGGPEVSGHDHHPGRQVGDEVSDDRLTRAMKGKLIDI